MSSRVLTTSADSYEYFFSQPPANDAATTIAGHAAPDIANLYTKPFLVVSNNDITGNRKCAYLDWIELTVITPGTGGTSDNWAAELDTGVRYSSGALTRLTSVNTNMQSTGERAVNAAVIDCGPYVAVAPTVNQRKLGLDVFRPSIAVAGDKYLFVFGDVPTESTVVSAAITHHIVAVPPVALGPNDKFLLHLFAPGQSAAGVYKVRMQHRER
jgi:hypothetical protein